MIIDLKGHIVKPIIFFCVFMLMRKQTCVQIVLTGSVLCGHIFDADSKRDLVVMHGINKT